jgi:hypothetical protein
MITVILGSALLFQILFLFVNLKFKFISFSIHSTSLVFSVMATVTAIYLSQIPLKDKLLDSTLTHEILLAVATG